jgi:molybdopterin synthase catalytic subunit
MIRISPSTFDPGKELSAFEQNVVDAGAIVSFLGRVRADERKAGVMALHLEHYPGVTERMLGELEDEARGRWAIDEPLIIHRVGDMTQGEPIVFVCVSARHRRDAFEAADFLMDHLKTKALFWKKEITSDGEEWIEPRAQDYKDAARWNERDKDN